MVDCLLRHTFQYSTPARNFVKLTPIHCFGTDREVVDGARRILSEEVRLLLLQTAVCSVEEYELSIFSIVPCLLFLL